MKRILINLVLVGVFLNVYADKIKPPNILFAIADDASWRSFSAYGNKWIKTPAFDEVAKKGILFQNAYTPNAKCAPSRSCILTGRNSWQLEEAANHSPHFPEKFKTYAEALAQGGYFVGSVAKGWSPGDPGEINGAPRELAGKGYNKYKTTPPASGMRDNDYAKNFEFFLSEKPSDKPFCFWFGSYEPHRAYEFKSGINKGNFNTAMIDQVPPFWPDADSVRSDMLDYAFELEYFDSHLAKMIALLEEKGELDNTIIVVTADNGMPFPNVKGQVYEYSNHLPLAIMWPAGIKNPGRVVSDYVNFIDFAPTFLDLAGMSLAESGMQPITGKSLLPILQTEKSGRVERWRNYVLVGKERHDVGRPDDQGYPVRGLVKNNYLYLHNYATDRWPVGDPITGYQNTDKSPTKSYILNTRRNTGDLTYWQKNFGKRPTFELYDIVADPYCMENLALNGKHDRILKKMEREMVSKLEKQGDPRMFGKGDIFDKYPYAGDARDYYNRVMRGEEVKKSVLPSDIDKDIK